MKTKLLTLISAGALLVAGTESVRAGEDRAVAAAADVLVVRPVCLAATVVGSAVFVVALPFALLSKSVKPTAHVLVTVPAQATFSRPVGDFDELQD